MCGIEHYPNVYCFQNCMHTNGWLNVWFSNSVGIIYNRIGIRLDPYLIHLMLQSWLT